MTEKQKDACSSLTKIILGAAIGAVTTAATVGMVIGEDRTAFRRAAERSVRNTENINAIHIQMAEERVRTSNIIELLNEMKDDIKAIRAAE